MLIKLNQDKNGKLKKIKVQKIKIPYILRKKRGKKLTKNDNITLSDEVQTRKQSLPNTQLKKDLFTELKAQE